MKTEIVTAHDAFVGRALREARLNRHIKQSELAQALNVTRSTITRWESGTRPMAVSTLLTIAELLEVPASLLLPEHHQLSLAPNHPRLPVVNEVPNPWDGAASGTDGSSKMSSPRMQPLYDAPNLPRALAASEASTPYEAATRAVGQILDVRPDLIPTVVALLETLVEDDETTHATPDTDTPDM